MADGNRGRTLVRASSANQVSQLPKSNDVPQRSQSTQLPLTFNVQDELRQRAIRNEQVRHTSITSLEAPRAVVPPHKNIPMLDENSSTRTPNPHLHSHKSGNRWSQFSMNNSLKKPPQSSVEGLGPHTPIKKKINISPLTQIKQPASASSVLKGGDYSSERGSANSSGRTSNAHSNTLSLTERLLGHSWKLTGRTGKVSSHASMNTLVPMSRHDVELNTSEEEDDDEAGEESHGEVDRMLATGDAEDVDLTTSLTIFDIAKELQDFQNMVALPHHQDPSGTNRTQQKVLDLKQYQEEQESLVVSHLLDHAVKIQNEALLSTWTLLRLRFSSHATGESNSNLRCSAGVLGSIQRKPIKETGTNQVKRSEKEEYLLNMWTNELHDMFDGYLKPTLIGGYDEDIYQDTGAGQPFNMSHMALRALHSRSESQLG